ncbi:MAG TPA: biotin--[acetyl-CoA-carboxylase] ligase [Caulobacteraceae bacterium]
MARIPILALDEIDSTNAEARRRAEASQTGPLWITALRQTAGRGRRGRSWETGEGNLAATYLFTTTRKPAEAAQVSFVAALAAADLASRCVPPSKVSLKWPNDLLIAGKKAAGILAESGLGEEDLWVAVGIGVNLAKAPASPERPATSFAEHMSAPPPAPLDALTVLAEAFDRWRGLWDGGGFGPIADAWTERAHGIGERCIARLANETVDGIAEGLDSDGALKLRTANGNVRRITAGDVFF